MTYTIPLSTLSQYQSGLASDSDAHSSQLTELRDLTRFDSGHRTALADAVSNELREWAAPRSAMAAADRLRAQGTYAVITGQQAGIATGPLYTLYKAIGAIRTARDLQSQFPSHLFVPVFWIEGDDHDFDEARRLGVIDRSGSARTLAYDDGDTLPRHVGDRKVNRHAFSQFIVELRAAMLETEFTAEMLSVLESAYMIDGATLASGFARSLYALLGDVPLVVVSSRNPGLKWLARDVIEREARDPDALFTTLESRTIELRAMGAATPIVPKRGALFMTHDGSRRAVDSVDDAYVLRETGRHYSREELAALAVSSPENFSPNVALRPIVQDAILPTAVYIGGPTELAYLQQISASYNIFGLQAPATAARPFVQLMEPKAQRVLEFAGLQLGDVMSEDFSAAEHVVDETVDGAIDVARARAIASVRSGLSEFEELTKLIDQTLEKTLGATGAGVEKGVEDFTKRLRSALKRKSQTDIDRLETARELILPSRKLQERTLNALYFVNKYGLARFQKAMEEITSGEGVLQVIAL